MLLWWLLLACLLLLPVLSAFVGDEPPDNAICHEQLDAKPQDPDAEFAPAA